MAEWKCPKCTYINPGTTRICELCYYNLDTGVQLTSFSAPTSAATSAAASVATSAATSAASAASAAPKQINGDELFYIPSTNLFYNETTKNSAYRYISELGIPILTDKPDNPPPNFFYAIVYEMLNIIEIIGLSEIIQGRSNKQPYNPEVWTNNESLDSFIAKEFPTCPVNTYIARDPELSTLCRRILEEEGREGFIIGESHSDHTPKMFLIDNMAELKRCGVTHLFLEHFFYNTLIQRDLIEKKMTKLLDQTLDYKYHGSKGGYDFRELILSAWANNITVIGIDTDKSYTIGGTPGAIGGRSAINTKARITAMNYVARKIINDEKQGKFVALIGENHLSKIPGGCLGIADICNVPSIIFNVHSGEKAPEINVRNLVISDAVGSSTLSRVDYVYYIKERRSANFKGGRRSRRSKKLKKKNRLSFRHRKTKLK